MLSKAKDVANGLPGGSLLIEDQDQIIKMLEELRDRKRCVATHICRWWRPNANYREQLALFSEHVVQVDASAVAHKMVTDIDSNASTPAAA
jgi:hypothetical protein